MGLGSANVDRAAEHNDPARYQLTHTTQHPPVARSSLSRFDQTPTLQIPSLSNAWLEGTSNEMPAAYEIRAGGDVKNKKQSMADLKLRRLNELNSRLREDLERPRIRVSEASMS